jgi:hypothetical protein
MPAPFNVKPAETAVPKFTLRDELTRAESTEWATLILPNRWPTLAEMTLLPIAPLLDRHRVEVSDCQIVCSQDVPPGRPDTVYSTSPIPDPWMIRLIDPDDTAFTLLDTLMQDAVSKVRW